MTFASTAQNFRALRERMKKAQDAQTLSRVEASVTRIYNAGQLSPKELQRLDVYAMEKHAEMEIAGERSASDTA